MSWADLVYVCNWRFFLIILMRDVFYRFIYCFPSNYDFDTKRKIYDGAAACCDSFTVFTKGGRGDPDDGGVLVYRRLSTSSLCIRF